MSCRLLLFSLLALCAFDGFAQAPPAIFFSDLESGPASGGQNNQGAFVSLYGKGFGATRGSSTVTVGGGAAGNYPSWSDTKIVFQLGAAAASGAIVVTVDARSSNAVAFTVRSGNIYFVAGNGGDDNNDGSYAHPWASIPHAKNVMAVGGIAYLGTHAGDQVAQTSEDNFGAALSMDANDGSNSGAPGAPKALVAYPGATATIGVVSGLERGILTPGIAGAFDHWVIAGLVLRGQGEAIELEGEAIDWRIVGNDISCPNGSGLSACVATGGSSYIRFLGNEVHDAAANVSEISKYYHAVYFSTDTNHVEVGWNEIRDGKTCRAVQFHSSPLCVPACGAGDTTGFNQFDLIVHDNLIHGTVCDGINFATVDPSQGPVAAYNNVIYDVGNGPDPVEGSSDYSGIYVAGTTNTGAPGGGTVEIYNNTLYNCGAWTSQTSAGGLNNGGGNPNLALNARDNIVFALAGEAYIAPAADAALISGSNNLWFGAGAPPPGFSANVNQDPQLLDAPAHDFHPSASSPAIDRGATTGVATDFDGVARPQGVAYDIGAYEFVVRSDVIFADGFE